jgi:DNA-directed RNA polymerase specialized sigma24 family protein
MKNLQIYKILKEPISETNVNRISELIVLRAIRTHCGYDRKYDKLYKGLLSDMFKSSSKEHSFSDAYDLVQDVNIFLLSYLGRQVDEVLYFDKKGFPITICKACYKIVDHYAWIQTRDSKIYCELDEAIEYNTIPEVFYDTEEAYENVENLIKAMELSSGEEDTLRLLYNGISSHEIAAKLDICFQTVYLRRKRMQNKYLQLKNTGGI